MQQRGRGANENPRNRFEAMHVEIDEDSWVDEDARSQRTVFLNDDSRTILSPGEADDLSFDYGLNPYRGCEHGCAYCYARTYHEFLGFSAGLDFESKIVVKSRAPELLEETLAKASYKPGKISLSGVTDCYQPIERKLEITRRCLEVLARFRNPVVVITKNALIERDIDHLVELARYDAVAVYLSVTTLDPALARILEPRASSPRARLKAIQLLSDAGILAGVSAAPMIPGLNDSELPAILEAAADHGAQFAAYSIVRLPGTVAEVFGNWLDRHKPLAKEKILGRIRAAHEGKLNAMTPGVRMRGSGVAAEQTRKLFQTCARRLGLQISPPSLNLGAFRRLSPGQQELF